MTTNSAHMPKRHAHHHKWTPQRLRRWGRDVGTDTEQWIQRQLDSKDHPEQAYRLCLGLLNLSRTYPASRLNGACKIANREQLDLTVELPQDHENIRGPQYFHSENDNS